MRKKIAIGLCILLTVLGAAGCGASYKSDSMKENTSYDCSEASPMEAKAEADSLDYTTASVAKQEDANVYSTGQKLIRTVNICMETKEYDTVLKVIDEKVKKTGSYIERSEAYGRGYDVNNFRSLNMTIRVPKDTLDSFVEGISQTGTVTNKTETTEDVTLNYVDTESRIKALTIQKDKLFELLEKASDMESIIALEQRISEVTYELESYSSKLRAYDNQVDYSTLNIDVYEVSRETKVVAASRLEKMGQGLLNSLCNIRDGFLDFCVGIVIALPYLILIGVVILVSIIIVKKKRKNRNKNKEIQ